MRIADIETVEGLEQELKRCEDKLWKVPSWDDKKIVNLTNKIATLKHIIQREYQKNKSQF